MAIKLLIFGIILGVVPFALGSLLARISRKEGESLLFSWVFGLIAMMAIFQLMAVPCVLMGENFFFLKKVYLWTLAAFSLLALPVSGRTMLSSLVKAGREVKKWKWPLWLAIGLISFQTIFLTAGRHVDDDDAFYVTMATEAASSGAMYTVDAYTGQPLEKLQSRYVLSPFPIWIAAVASTSGIHPAVLAHSLLPLLLIPFAYMIGGLLAAQIFPGNREAWGWFLIVLSLVQMCSAFSPYTSGVFLLTRIWQGKALLAGGLLPAVWYTTVRAHGDKGNGRDFILLLMVLLASCLVSSMGILLGLMAGGICGLACGISYRRFWTLPAVFLTCVPSLAYGMMYIFIR